MITAKTKFQHTADVLNAVAHVTYLRGVVFNMTLRVRDVTKIAQVCLACGYEVRSDSTNTRDMPPKIVLINRAMLKDKAVGYSAVNVNAETHLCVTWFSTKEAAENFKRDVEQKIEHIVNLTRIKLNRSLTNKDIEKAVKTWTGIK